jgi:PAS domain S-box-containing protein
MSLNGTAPAAAAPRLSNSVAPDFRAVFEASPRPLLLIDADPPKFTMLAVNRAHAAAFGATPEALEGRGVLEVFPASPNAEVVAFVEAVRASLNRVMETAAADQMPIRPYAVVDAKGSSEERYWSAVNTPILTPEGAVSQIVSSAQDVTGEVLERRSETARTLLMKEVDHRARNALTVVQSFIRLTRAPSLEGFRLVLEGRVEALARAQTSLAERRWEGAILGDLVTAALSALSDPGRYRVVGPPVLLNAEQVQALSMIVHELATNASKHGALSAEHGVLTISWSKESQSGLQVTWLEEGGPAARPPNEEGFGSRLISQLVRQLKGDIRYHWGLGGLRAQLNLPL